jgi:signal transduction histidine kinase
MSTGDNERDVSWPSARSPAATDPTFADQANGGAEGLASGAAWELAAEAITVRIRWFGLCVGYVLVNWLDREMLSRPVLNSILTLGAVYALLDTLWSLRGKVFLSEWPLAISILEAVFIGLLCYFDQGLESPFRFYYFLSVLVCALRHSRQITFSTFALHCLSFCGLVLVQQRREPDELVILFLTLVVLGWVTWASTALAGVMQGARRHLASLNVKLQQNQTQLEVRIDERTRELQESQAHVVQQEKQAAFGLLAAGIAHEVGNPLAAISSLVQMLNRHHTDDYSRERYQMMDDQLRRIQRTLRELIDFSRPATKDKVLCDVQAVIDAALNIAKYYTRMKGKKVVTKYADGLPPLRVARDQLVQVFLNLILNAMDATNEGGTIEIETAMAGERIRVAIKDNGHGISPDARSRIFQPYYTTKDFGTGLGLFVCRNIMEQTIGGTIELTETSPGGTTFAVLLNAEPALELPPEASVSRPEPATVSGS